MNRKIAYFKVPLLFAALYLVVFGEKLATGAALALGSTDAAETDSDGPDRRLESLVVDVNGERKRVEAGASFHVVYGDLVTIVEASLVDKSTPVELVDLVGFRSSKSQNSGDDRGWVIDTGRHLSKKRSVAGDGRQYRIRVSDRRGINGEVMLNILDPELLSIALEVNGSVRQIHSGDVLRLGAKDLVRVVEVRTNVRGNENVKYDKVAKRGSKELRFSRGGRIFARIPIEWQMP